MDSPGEQLYFFDRYGPDEGYCSQISLAAFNAIFKVFRIKQSVASPDFSSFVQAEHGDRDLHVHIVAAGQGLNKYNAKSSTKLIAYHFFRDLKDAMNRNKDSAIWPTPANDFYAAIDPAITECQAENVSKYCTILQYKARATGDTYACRVDATEYITNYLLPKNLKCYTFMDPQRHTPASAFFATYQKTYAHTRVNGIPLDPFIRRQLHTALNNTVVNKSVEPVFSGDPFMDLPEVGKTTWTKTGGHSSTKMSKRETLMCDCLKRCVAEHLLTYEDLIAKHPDMVIMIESQPGGSRLLEQLLQMVHIKITQQHTALTYISARYADSVTGVKPENKVFQLLNKQGYNPWQVGHWICCVLHKQAGKQNTISFYGPASTGKTNLAKAIVNTVKLYGCVNHQNKNFIFNDAAAKLVIWWEECLMHTDWVEQSKCCLGGTEFRIDRKHRDSMLLPQTPVIISTNNDIYSVVGGNSVNTVHAKPIRERVVQYNLMKQLPPTFGEITVQEVAEWLLTCATNFPISLDGFLNIWNLEAVPNDFPLNKLCASHTQDFILHEVGLCSVCGGYIPLEHSDRSAEPAIPSTSTADGELPMTYRPTLLSDFQSAIADFDLFLLATPPTTPRKRRLDSEDEQPSTSTSTHSSSTKRRLSVSEEVAYKCAEFLDKWASQPQDECEEQLFNEEWRGIWGNGTEQDTESKPDPAQRELSPSEWGEILGVQKRATAEEEPLVLWCFETLEDDKNDSVGGV
ncbi:nonstructural protein [Bat bocavirus XM30]|uniref:Initiator protein NS1 n=1 Tax=Bat bocavirus XM30 TaxID=2259811 RepID=R4LAH7_9VIRU|nr:nonstructural protein [Bat bocavirus XM30]AGL09956.1 nonstructural protein [Bat bocavirus XM30]